MIRALLAFVRRVLTQQQDSIAIEQQRRRLLTAQRVQDEMTFQPVDPAWFAIVRADLNARGHNDVL